MCPRRVSILGFGIALAVAACSSGKSESPAQGGAGGNIAQGGTVAGSSGAGSGGNAQGGVTGAGGGARRCDGPFVGWRCG
jgi:hypothetical protein